MIVVDASALVEVLARTSLGVSLQSRLLTEKEELAAPHLIDLEVTQVLRRWARAGVMTDARGRLALDDLIDFPVQRYPHTIFLERIWQLRDNLTAYDAAYVALAESLDAPLLTRDRALMLVSGHHATIELI